MSRSRRKQRAPKKQASSVHPGVLAISLAGLFVMCAAVAFSRVGTGAVSLSERAGLESPVGIDPANQTDDDARTRPGQRAPDILVQTVPSGNYFDLGIQRRKVVLLNFFTTWCPECVEELPHLQSVWEKYGQNDRFVMCAVSVGEDEETVLTFLKEHGYTFPAGLDPELREFHRYALDSIPRTYLIDPESRIVSQMAGFDTEEFDQMQREIELALK